MKMFNKITEKLLKIVSEYDENAVYDGAYSIREDGKCVATKSSDHITIEQKEDRPGMNVHVDDGTKGESVYIPTCVTEGGIEDIVYNDFFIGKDCDIMIGAGCGVSTEDDSEARHNGVHRLFIGENSHVVYEEKHIGLGSGQGQKMINPSSQIELADNAYLEINATQISGLTKARRSTGVKLGKHAKLVVRERLLTEADQRVDTTFTVYLNGEDSSADLVSRSVARDNSCQYYKSTIVGNTRCKGHSECDSIIDENAVVDSMPRLVAKSKEASLIHEAAIGKIAGEQILKLRTLGLSEEEAESQIITGFLE